MTYQTNCRIFQNDGVSCSYFLYSVITSEECVPKHKLLVMDMWFKATKRWRRKFEPRVRVWKLKEEKTCKEYMHSWRQGRGSKMERPGCKWSLATDERYNDGNSSGYMWNGKRSMQTQGNMVVEWGRPPGNCSCSLARDRRRIEVAWTNMRKLCINGEQLCRFSGEMRYVTLVLAA